MSPGSATFQSAGDTATISVTIADDSHNHTIANVDGLRIALDTKYESGDNISVGTVASGAITITNATNSGGTARNVYQSTSQLLLQVMVQLVTCGFFTPNLGV